jgi:two-component system, OmpR family, sensor histidine kinase VicK
MAEKNLIDVLNWELISWRFALFAIAIGLFGLTGWLLDISLLRTFLSDDVSMKVNTAILIILCGVSLAALNKGYINFPRFLIFAVILLALAIVYEHLTDTDLQIDQLIFRDAHTNLKLEAPGRTTLLTALYILLAASALLLLSFKNYGAAQFAALTVIALVYISLMGHLFHIIGFYTLGTYSNVAFHTAVALLLLAGGIMFTKPSEGWIARVYRQLAIKNLFIYFLSYFMGAAPLFAAMYLFVIKNGSFSPASDVLVLFTLTIILSFPVAFFLLRLVNKLNQSAKGAHEQLRIAVLASGIGVWDLDLESGLLVHSDKFAEFFDNKEQLLSGAEQLWAAFHPDDSIKGKLAFENALIHGQLDLQVRVITNKDTTRWIQFYGETQKDKSGRAIHMLGTAMDITPQKEAERQKDEFISVASHELKTPLTSLKSYVQLAHIKSNTLEENTISIMLEKAELQINKMTRMIGDFLNVARSESGKMAIQKKQFFMEELISEVISDLSGSTTEIKISLTTCQELPVIADRDKIEQVLTNLISNAIKYSPGNKPVVLSCYREGEMVLISVRDEGIGISEKDKLYLFDRFFRAENPRTLTVSGFGIGLYLSSEIIRLHGGKIWVDSEVGKGSSFWFSLPVDRSYSIKELKWDGPHFTEI